MNENAPASARLLALDHFVDDKWYKVTAVTDSDMIIAATKTGKQQAILSALDAGEDPVTVLKNNSPLGQGPKIFALRDIDALEWYSDAATLKAHYTVNGKSKKAEAKLSSMPNRDVVRDVVQQIIGPCEQRDAPASIWYIGMTPLTLSGISLLVFGIPGFTGLADPGQVDVDKVSRRGRLLARLYNMIGPVGLLAIGGAIISGLLIWWYISCKTPPVRTIARPVQQGA
ncbi:MAG: hypothetical protein CME31_09420 [Gimesia sp.]|uniref:Uncharacterized protein n=1 Tax=Gimesia maris TaxID=122 RepID=A0A3D3R8U0_9PLAN|nr:hypothetical protein [Gimesia sp.]HCO24040.1 hypothetical protein [Gimesia maris]|tara:strand:+ start:26419 stop:27102 length:684 start_codon:yes stop_codon:yes gene_type:complete